MYNSEIEVNKKEKAKEESRVYEMSMTTITTPTAAIPVPTFLMDYYTDKDTRKVEVALIDLRLGYSCPAMEEEVHNGK